jgi:hypothetical protein
MDLIKELLQGIQDRLKSTFIFSYALIWIAYNWSFVYITFLMNDDFFKNASQFEYLASHQNFVFEWKIPLCLAFLTSITLPLINSVINFCTELITFIRNFLITKYIHQKIPTDPKIYAAAVKKLNEIDKELKTLAIDKDVYENKINNLNDTIESFNKNNGILIGQNEKYISEINEHLETAEMTNKKLKELETKTQIPKKYFNTHFRIYKLDSFVSRKIQDSGLEYQRDFVLTILSNDSLIINNFEHKIVAIYTEKKTYRVYITFQFSDNDKGKKLNTTIILNDPFILKDNISPEIHFEILSIEPNLIGEYKAEF